MFNSLFGGMSGLVEVVERTPEGVFRSTFLTPKEFISRYESGWFNKRIDFFFGPALRMFQSSERNAVSGGKVLWADFDASELPEILLPPSFVVRTHRGYHLYWAINELIQPDEIEALNRLIAKIIGADNCWNANRILRIPGTLHREGSQITLLYSKPFVYTTKDIVSWEKVPAKTVNKVFTADSRGYRSRSELDFAVIKSLHLSGLSMEAIRIIFDSWKIGAKMKEHSNPDHYFGITYEKAAEAVVKAKEESGVRECNNCFYIGKKQVTTFTFDPVLLLEGERDAFLGDVYTLTGVWRKVILPKDAFTSTAALSKALPRAEWSVLGNDSDVRQLLPLIVQKWQLKGSPKIKGTSVLGRHEGMFVLPEHVITDAAVLKQPNAPIAYIPGAVKAPSFFVEDVDLTADEMRERLESVLRINRPEVMFPILGWWLATPIKIALWELQVPFPTLNIFGTRGAGKTTTIFTVMRLFGVKQPVTIDSSTTRFVVLALLGQSNAIPVAFSEYRSASAKTDFLRYIRLAYDLGEDPRGRPELKVESFPLLAPFVVDGEDGLDEPAAKERVVGVRLRPQYIQNSEYVEALSKVRTDGFFVNWIKYSLKLDVRKLWYDAQRVFDSFFSEDIPYRVRRNYVVVTAGLLAAKNLCGLPFSVETLTESINNSYNMERGARLHIMDFVEAVCNAAYRHVDSFFWKYDSVGNILYFQLSSAARWWQQESRKSGELPLSKDALAAQLQEVYWTTKPVLVEGVLCFGVRLSEASKLLDIPERLP